MPLLRRSLRDLLCLLPPARVAAVLAVALTVGACGASAGRASGPVRGHTAAAPHSLLPGEAPCGPAAAEVTARAAALVAQRIYGSELASPEVSADRRQVEGYEPLLQALAAGDRPGALAAVTSLVYSHTHIVRLRVSAHGRVVADVGGPYIIAPVAGSLRLHGRIIGSYVLSVQDDLGYVKLESRYVGVPMLIREGSRRIPLEGELPAAAARIPSSGPARWAGSSYEAISFQARAFPSGALRVTLLVPVAAAGAAHGCQALHAAELGSIGDRIWTRFISVGAQPQAFAIAIRGLTGALAFVRAGSRQLASGDGPGPRHLRDSGLVRYRGTTYAVESFPAHADGLTVRVYQLLVP